MKTKLFSFVFLLSLVGTKISAQDVKSEPTSENYGRALNLGLGIGYYGYVGHSMPVVHADFEFTVAKNFTLAPFITVFSYQNDYYWGNPKYPYRYYSYRQTVIPIGVKGTYYFDQLLNAGSKWDFYLAGSLGFVYRKTTWSSDYYGETTAINSGTSGLYLDAHIGTEYHFNDKIGMFLDLSTGISTIGLSFHM